MQRKMALGFLSILAVGCGAEYDVAVDEQTSSADEIIGGTPTSELPAVVAIYGKKPGEDKGALCTATVIAPKVLLTAAHCVDPKAVGEGLEFKAIFNPDLRAPEAAASAIKVAEVHWNTAFDIQNPMAGNDIAVVILEKDTDIKPMPFMRKAMPSDLTGKPVTIIGYGLSKRLDQTSAGTKRIAEVKLNSFDDKFVKTGGFNRGICSGDSGGPILMDVDGIQTIVGVNSFGMIFCLTEASSTRVDKYLDFVNKYVK